MDAWECHLILGYDLHEVLIMTMVEKICLVKDWLIEYHGSDTQHNPLQGLYF